MYGNGIHVDIYENLILPMVVSAGRHIRRKAIAAPRNGDDRFGDCENIYEYFIARKSDADASASDHDIHLQSHTHVMAKQSQHPALFTVASVTVMTVVSMIHLL
jgi:hypothetical protein